MTKIKEKPFTLNVLYAAEIHGIRSAEKMAEKVIETTTFATAREALAVAREEVLWENTIHATITDERTGKEIFDEAGWS